ncbi:hypothetical protein [Candidatus Thiodictyon syntrophicum]|jgi:histidyl-tRNA synthetase|nr:hypothetical protein [Candidatus Thiodictyon syntrophicum]
MSAPADPINPRLVRAVDDYNRTVFEQIMSNRRARPPRRRRR